MNTTSIRPLVGSDLSAIVSIWNRSLTKDPISEQRFLQGVLCDNDYWPGEDSGFFVATQDDLPIGFLRAIIRRWPNDRVGLEPEDGWIPVVAVDPDHQRCGVGVALLNAALNFFRSHRRKRIWVCGKTGSAPGYVFCGVDKHAYPGALRLFSNAGFVVNNEPVAMSREVVTFDATSYESQLKDGPIDLHISHLAPQQVEAFFDFLAHEFPGDWNIAARSKIKQEGLDEILVATLDGHIVGYCQWSGEHFGPFGVSQSARNKNIGGLLLLEAIRRIREADGRNVWFNWADEDAARFYRRFGFEVTREFALFRKDL